MTHLEKAHKAICQLAKDFQAHEKRYLSQDYSEAQARKDFIDKFFIALGWDVNHDQQKNPYEQEVKVEKGVNVARAQKRADYAFCLAPNYRDAKFFVEAKKPFKGLANADDYFQTARYGWNAGAPLCVLTDFEELHIIDCRFKPSIDTALKLCHKKFHYSDYTDKEKFAEIYWLFSHEAIANNAIEKLAETLKKPTGKAVQRGLFPGGFQPIDEAFLEEIDEIRKTLAKAFKKNVPEMYSAELTEAVQKTIDRLVFIRFLEDKLIEPEYLLDNIGQTGNAWAEFIAISRKLDKKYNGIVFKEISIDIPGFEGPVDAEFRDICETLSHQNTPYDFNYIPIHIIGSIYERFLGKEIHATAKRVDIEEKPEVRKAGGVYYTPQYIVRYIVENTIGKLIEGKTPEEISKLRFADIACGSGSFLIGAFDLLLEYHSKYYQAHPEKAKKDGCYHKEGKWVLSIKQKRNILLNNIYGVDIDSQAVEVTQLSLALKMLEDETTATANEMQVLYHDTVLPDLTKNIVCGNSLIGTDILQGNLFELDKEEERKLKPMDFASVFPGVMKNGGFDAVIGNPPYVFTRDVEWGEIVKNNFWQNFSIKKTGLQSRKDQSGKINLYILFILRAIKLLTPNGLVSYIVPNGLLRTTTYDSTRKHIVENAAIVEIADLKIGVFKGVTAATLIITIGKYKKNNKIKIIDADYKTDGLIHRDQYKLFSQDRIANNVSYAISIFVNERQAEILDKIKASNFYLKDVTKDIIEGIVASKEFIKDEPVNKKCKPFLEGKDIKRYQINYKSRFIVFDREKLHRARPDYIWEANKKIIIQRISGGNKPLVAAIDTEHYYSFASTNLLLLQKEHVNIYTYELVCALLNSNLINYYYSKNFTNSSELTVNRSKTFLEMIPLPCKNANRFQKVTNIVGQMLESKKQLAKANTEAAKNYYQQKCQSLDNQIDKLVYELYGLTEEEIKVVEG